MVDFSARMRRDGVRSLLAVALASVSSFALSGPAQAQSPDAAAHAALAEREYDIPAQPLSSALVRFAEQSDLQVLFSQADVAGMNSRPVRGRFAPEAALAQLLPPGAPRIEIAGDRLVRTDLLRPQRAENDGASGDEEIVVTGTRIRGAAPVGSQLVTLDRVEIEQSGLATTEQVTRTLPQVFGGDIAQHVSFQGGNIGGGSTINLRGLGADATLSLINGRRLPSIGLRGNFADVSTIPVSAIERIEVLPDSASAIYGSDAVGGVVNFIMRRDFGGAEFRARYGGVTEGDLTETRFAAAAGRSFGPLSLFASFEHFDREALAMADRAFLADSDLTALGGGNFDLLRSNPTTLIVSGLGAFAVPFGQDGTDLEESDLIAGLTRTANANEGLDALPTQTQNALFISGVLDLGPGLELFGDVRLVERSFLARNGHVSQRFVIPATNAFRAVHGLFPGRTVQADYDFYRDLGPRTEIGDFTLIDLALGARWSVGEMWAVEPTLAYARFGGGHRIENLINTTALSAALASSDPALAFNPLGDGSFTSAGTLESIRGYTLSDVVSEVWSIAAKADGDLFHLPAGAVRTALGADYRGEFYQIGGELFVTGTAPTPRSSTSNGRTITALFAEALIPLFGPEFAPPIGERIDLSLAARFERYSDFGETTNPKLGLEWSLSDALTLRASYGRSFRAPNLADLDPGSSINTRQVRGINITDPVSSTGVSQIIFIAGANPDLHEQTAESWSAGFAYDPPRPSGLRFSANYFDVRFSDRISSITNIAAAMFPNSEFASLVDRSPDPAVVAALIAEAQTLGTSGGFSAGDIDAIVDVRSMNLARTEVRGFDLSAGYAFGLGTGALELSADATWLTEFLRQAAPSSVARDVVGTVGNPVDWRARLSAVWRHEAWSLAAFVNYTGAYRDNLSAPQRDIDAWTTLDLNLSFDLPHGDGFAPRLAFSVNNAFDEDPPFVNNALGFGYDPANAHPLGRFLAVELSTRF